MSDDHKNTIVERVKKLLRLSKGTHSAAESENALLKAKELCAANGIRFESVDAEAPQIKEVMVLKDMRNSLSKQWIYGILDKHFGIMVCMGRDVGVYFVGPEENIEIGKFILTYLLQCEKREWEKTLEEYRVSFEARSGQRVPIKDVKKAFRKYKKDFVAGFYSKIYKRLEERPLRNDRIKDAVKKYMDEKYGELHERKANTNRRSDSSGFFIQKGLESGAGVSLSRPVEGTSMETAMIGGI